MIRKHRLWLLAATMLAGAVPAQAEDNAGLAAEIAALRAEVETLRAQVAELRTAQAALAQAPQLQLATMTTVQPQPTAQPAPEPGPEIRFRGAPQITAPGGWS